MFGKNAATVAHCTRRARPRRTLARWLTGVLPLMQQQAPIIQRAVTPRP